MSDDAEEVTGFRFYRIAWSYEHDGWSIFEQVDVKKSTLVFHSGPFNNEEDAKVEMRNMNEAQGMKYGGR